MAKAKKKPRTDESGTTQQLPSAVNSTPTTEPAQATTFPSSRNPAIIQTNFAEFRKSLCFLLETPDEALESAIGEPPSQFIQALREMKETGDMSWMSPSTAEKHVEAEPELKSRSRSPVPTLKNWPPPLPFINNVQLRQQAFTHRSYILGENASIPGVENQHYERLEFLGDAYIQSIVTHILYTRFPKLREGGLSSIRQDFVCNKNLGEYATLYQLQSYLREGKNKQNTPDKTIADCFEAYVGALILDGGERDGPYMVAQWLKELFEPKLKTFEKKHGSVKPIDKMARQSLATVCGGNSSKIEYEWTDGSGGNKGGYWITVKLTGWGFENRILGKGWGANKSDAQLRAAMNVLEDKDFVKEMEVVKAKILGPKPPKTVSSDKKKKRTHGEGPGENNLQEPPGFKGAGDGPADFKRVQLPDYE